jgi:hypothetical protein
MNLADPGSTAARPGSPLVAADWGSCVCGAVHGTATAWPPPFVVSGYELLTALVDIVEPLNRIFAARRPRRATSAAGRSTRGGGFLAAVRRRLGRRFARVASRRRRASTTHGAASAHSPAPAHRSGGTAAATRGATTGAAPRALRPRRRANEHEAEDQ